MHTYLDRFELAAHTICGNPIGAETLCDIFRNLSHPWHDRSLTKGPGFESGITSFGYPFELSLSCSASDLTSARFIVQPGIIDRSAVETLDYSIQQGISQVKNLVSVQCAAVISDVFAKIKSMARTDFRGNSCIWVGAEVAESSLRSIKVYINPWLITESVGLLVTDIMAIADCHEAKAGKSIARTIRCLGDNAVINLIGLDISRTGSISMKLYFVLRESISELYRRISQIPLETSSFLEILEDFCNLHQAGEIHLSLRLPKANCQILDTKVNLFTNDFFGDDNDVFRFLSRFVKDTQNCAQKVEQLRRFLETASTAPRRNITFVGLASHKQDIYFVP